MKKAFKFFGVIIAAVILFFAGAVVGVFVVVRDGAQFESIDAFISKGEKNFTDGFDFSLYKQVYDMIRNNYIGSDTIDDKELFYGSLTGIASGVKDPYTVFLKPSLAKKFSEDLNGSFGGIGIEIGMRNDQLTVIAPLKGTPADKAGLLAGDKIIAINGTSTMGMVIEDAVSRIRGPKGETVTLSIYRDGWSIAKDFPIVRDTIVVKSVEWEEKNNGDIFYVRLSSFGSDTIENFQSAVNAFHAKKYKGLVLDLRNNPGGFLEVASEMISFWAPEKISVISKGRESFNETNYVAEGEGKGQLEKVKTVVLVNQGSASASEILGGALQDYKLATLVGEKTFGKGSVQEMNSFLDGSALKVTVAHWYTPLGRLIDKEGIKPDKEVKMTEEDYKNKKDPQLDKAIELLK
ncbi:MAG: S41 family peptidase [Parcubacteria group bacterium]|nr:S41 family peptidase [Parcubacteria group bacterium]